MQHLAEEFPEVSAYLASLLPSSTDSSHTSPATHSQPSQYATDRTAQALTEHLMQQVEDVMQRAQAAGTDPGEELNHIVSSTVLESVLRGVILNAEANPNYSYGDHDLNEDNSGRGSGDEGGGKRSRRDDSNGNS